MKVTRKSAFFKSLVLIVAFALAILCFPIDNFLALAAIEAGVTIEDINYMTFSMVEGSTSTVVKKGAEFTVPDAYIGGHDNSDDALLIDNGDNLVGTEITTDAGDYTITKTSVEVRYGSAENKDTETLNGRKFTADKVGVYVITYSYSFTDESGREFTNSYDFKIESELSTASFNFKNNSKEFIPSIIDLSYVKDTIPNLYLPTPEVVGEDGEEIDAKEIETILWSPSSDFDLKEELEGKEHAIVIRVTDNRGGNVALEEVKTKTEGDDGEEVGTGKYYIDGEKVFGRENSAGTYSIKYSYYNDGFFVTSTTKETTVYAKFSDENRQNRYYQDYRNLTLKLDSTFPSSAQTGVAVALPTASGVTSSSSNPSNEPIDVYYTVEVKFMSSNSDRSYQPLDEKLYNSDPENPVVEVVGEGKSKRVYLIDPTTFKPLQNGWYTFIYTIKDYYGNEVSSSEGFYQFQNIKDETAPTPVLYDASVKDKDGKPTYEDASHKFPTNANANSVVVYAVGIEDNVSKNGDKDIDLKRRIMTATDEKYTIEHYDEYNLVFNYRNTAGSTATSNAWSNLTKYNYLVRKAIEKSEESVTNDSEMLSYLKKNGYLIVIDQGNLSHIYELFHDTVLTQFSTEDDFKNWLDKNDKDVKDEESKTEENRNRIAELGFAYLADCKETFGQTKSESTNGMGLGQYYVHYIAKDAEGLTRDVSKAIYIGTTEDVDAPTIKFPTALSTSYLPTAEVKFDSPSATDDSDNNMRTRTLYRYLKSDGNNGYEVVPFEGEEELVDLTELFEDLGQYSGSGSEKNSDKFKDYHKEGGEDGYREITDPSASSYTIKLKEADASAIKLQIVAFAYDDAGNANMYAVTVDILRTHDSQKPYFGEFIEKENPETLVSGTEVQLPDLVVYDDAVGYMTYNVIVKHVNGSIINDVDVAGAYATPRKTNTNGFGYYTIHGGSFTASSYGEYRVSIVAKDSANNALVYFTTYTVESRNLVRPPVISATLENQTVELNDKPQIQIPTPKVDYEIPDSVIYDEFKAAGNTSDSKYVVMGVDKDGYATDWNAKHCTLNMFEPDAVGNYDIFYTVYVSVYEHETFTYVEGTYGSKDGGYFTTSSESDAKFYLENEDEIKYVKGIQTYYLRKVLVEDEEGNVTETYAVFTANGDKVTAGSGIAPSVEKMEAWFKALKLYKLTSDVYTIKVQDTRKPIITKHDYVSKLEEDKLGDTFTIYGMEANEEIDFNLSKITVTWSPVDTKNGALGFTKDFTGSDKTFTVEGFGTEAKKNGTIRIVYTIYDKAGLYDTWEHTIVVGDTVAPLISYSADLVKEKYEVGSELRIDKTKIYAVDDGIPMESPNPEITLKDTTGNEVEINEEKSTEDVLVFNLDNVGTYTLTINVYDANGNKGTRTISIEVSARTKDTVMTYQVVGTILIVISVLILAGVIVYFIVSKVKLDKELKK